MVFNSVKMCQEMDDLIKKKKSDRLTKKINTYVSLLLDSGITIDETSDDLNPEVFACEKNQEKRGKNVDSIRQEIESLLNHFDEMKREKEARLNEIIENPEAMKNEVMSNEEAVNDDDCEEDLEKLMYIDTTSLDEVENEEKRSSNHQEKTPQLMYEIEALKPSIEIIEATNQEWELKIENMVAICNDKKAQIDDSSDRRKRKVVNSEANNQSGDDLSTGLPVEELRSNGIEHPSLDKGLESLFEEMNVPHGESQHYYNRKKQLCLATKEDIKRLKNEFLKYDDKLFNKKTNNLRKQKEVTEMYKASDKLGNEIFGDFDFATQAIENSEQATESKCKMNVDDSSTDEFGRNNDFEEEIGKLEIILNRTEYFGCNMSQKNTHIDIDLGITENKIRSVEDINQTLKKQITDVNAVGDSDADMLEDS